jgi:methyl-accepting chemotaxis protein
VSVIEIAPPKQSTLFANPNKRVRQTLDGRLSLIKTVALVVSGVSLITIIICLMFGILGGKSILFIILGLAAAEVIICGLVYYLAKPGGSLLKVTLLTYLLTLSLLALFTALQPLLGAGGSVAASFIIIPLTAGALGLTLGEIAINTVLAALALSITYSLQHFTNSIQPQVDLTQYPALDLTFWLLLLVSIAVVFFVFSWRMNNAAQVSETQADLLRDLLVTLNTTTEFGISLSRELTAVTAELNSTSLQQASGAQQQVASVTEVTTSLEELNETANQIAANAEIAAMSANQGVAIANQVKANAELARTSVIQGEEAVEQTTASVERVRNRIELLGQRLLYLTEQNRKVGSIIDIIDEIADETHLLALNASIEAAGSVVSNGTAGHHNIRGERFGVIAQEVKSLADRSRESTEEVREAITEMQGAVAAAVLVAEESKKDTAAALSRSQIAGTVIGKLNQVIAASAASAEQILRAVEEVNVRCEEIKIATGQQRSANQQILSTMRYISDVARENANAVSGISGAVSRVNNRLDELNMVLDKSSQSIQAAGV